MNIGRILLWFITGFPLVIGAVAIATGGWGNAATILVISIVCTAGIGLIVWIPLCCGVGWLMLEGTRWIVRLVQGTPTASPVQPRETQSSDRPPSNRSSALILAPQIALEDYVKRAISLGHDYARITAALTAHGGWTEAEIRQVYDAITQA